MPVEPASERFEPRAVRALAAMFDDVSGRYRLLNRLMTLGRDRAWRRAVAQAVPENARVVIDLCTGDGAMLQGLRRPGRLVVGVDASERMLDLAAGEMETEGWAPRLLCADAFRLPIRDAVADAITIGFGIRNLRPLPESLGAIRRLLRPGGLLLVLEATGPAPGPLASIHRLHLRHGVPALGRLSPDPSAYRYLAESILEFGDGRSFEDELRRAGFRIEGRRRFLLGAARLWVARATGVRGENPSAGGALVQDAMAGPEEARGATRPFDPVEEEGRIWTAAQAVVSAALAAALVWGLFAYAKFSAGMFLEPWQRTGGWAVLTLGAAFAAYRTVSLIVRLGEPASRR